MIKIFISLSIGIYLGLNYPDETVLEILGFEIGCLMMLFVLFRKHLRYQFNWYNYLITVLLLISITTLGYWRAMVYKDLPTPFVQNIIENNSSVFQFKITDNLGSSKKFYKYEANLEAIIKKDSIINTDYKTILYVSKNDAISLKYGDNIWTKHKLILLTDPLIDTNGYYRYLKLQNIYFVSFLYRNQVLKIDSNKVLGVDFHYYIYVLKEKLSRLFNRDIHDKNAAGLAMALLYGNRSELDKSLLNAYTQTGVVHIIAVSGMHVSLLYGLIILLWNILGKVINLKPIYKVWVVGIFIGMFTALAGFTPSILRASIVFGILLWGEYKHKTIYNYNNLAAAGWILLWLKPTNIYDLGYQLSFLAVLGIMLYARPLERLLYFKNYILKQLWLCITLCVAAQLTTFPLIIYYFKQFPLLFIYTNIIIIFWSTIILYLIIVLVMVSWVPFLSAWIGWLIQHLTLVMNAIVLYFQKIPYASVSLAGFSIYALWGIYGGLFLITYIIYRRVRV